MAAPKYSAGTGSAVAIAGHPLHPMVVPLPIGSIALALCADIAFMVTRNPFWSAAAFWLLVAALISGAVAALLGLIELIRLHRAHHLRIGIAHGIGNAIVMGLVVANLFLPRGTAPDSAYPWGLVLSVAAVLLVMVTGWLGGEMSYRHGIGVAASVGSEDAASGQPASGYRADYQPGSHAGMPGS
ncbi:MAG TPA: DUF2231 domain-containing protein [Ferrovibrio sp.]|jgi:uncharacterized membrane protein|uniref:DUF2231 domain-containing protein n=1 Tax=Ferrovibrio sp. TaxID=1917215 RepID=UPI002ED52009